jgi:hypothetical protein
MIQNDSSTETQSSDEPQIIEKKHFLNDINKYLALTLWFMGYSISTGQKSVVIPAQVKLLVPPENKEFYNGLIMVPR